MISRSAEYCLRAVACLAQHPEAAMTTHQIADETHVPVGYLSKVLQALVRAGFVTSQRGINGGFVLATSPEELTLLEVVRVCDPSTRVIKCPLDKQEHEDRLCPLHQRLDHAAALVEEALASETVASIIKEAPAAQVNHD